ncbi:hypothetical protein HCH52_11480 [Oscillospiraceae bacterium HV4-5-C5C]|nr:hypothetical protein [Oscillospiraceae bacterium HV4-5-C5C]
MIMLTIRASYALFFGGFALAAVLAALVWFLNVWVRKQKGVRELSSLTHKFAAEKLKTDTIFSSLDLGVLAYGADGHLSYANQAAAKLLDLAVIPEELDDFLTAYGDVNGIKTRMILGRGQASGTLKIDNRTIKISIKTAGKEDPASKSISLIILQDITDQELLEQQRKEFVANVSHELKTPLTTIITYSESLLDWGLEEKQKEGLRKDIIRIHDDAKRMEDLVSDLLLLSSIDSRKMSNRMEMLNLEQVVRQTVERMQFQAQQKQIDLDCISMATVPPILGDRSSIERIISNLLSNAIKYTDKKGEIKVYVGLINDAAYVKVTDNGYGIEEKYQSQIFNRFYRVDMTGSRLYGGTGLGLSIVKELVAMHHGQIDVKSALGKGSSFTVMFSLADKVMADTLSSFAEGAVPSDNLSIAAMNEIIEVAHDQGIEADTLEDLSANQIATLLSWFQHKPEKEPAIMEERPAEPTPETAPSFDAPDQEVSSEPKGD